MYQIDTTKYNRSQLVVMATMAWYCYNAYQKAHGGTGNFSIEYCKICADAIAHAAAQAGVNDNDLQLIRNGYIKGMQNINRFSEVLLYDQNYKFDFMTEYGILWKKSQQVTAQ